MQREPREVDSCPQLDALLFPSARAASGCAPAVQQLRSGRSDCTVS